MLPDSRALRSSRVVFSAELPFAHHTPSRSAQPDALDLGQRWSMELFPGEAFQLVPQRIERSPDGVTTWVANMPDDEFGEALISQRGDDVFAEIRRHHRVYHLRSAAGGAYFAEELDPLAWPDNEHDEVHGKASPAGEAKPAAGLKSEEWGTRTVDVAVLYTQAAAARQDIALFVNNAAAEMNQSFINSGVDGSIRIVYYGPSTFVEAWPMDFDPHFALVVSYMQTNQGDFGGLSDLRNAVRADLVILLIDATAARDTCGIGQMPNHVVGAPNQAFSVTGDTCVTTMRNFTHEIGHNLGGGHDKDLPPPPSNIPYGYSYGYSHEQAGFRTIMGSKFGCDMQVGCPRINYWSNPDLMYQGTPMGTAAEANLALSHNNWIIVPAIYRSSGDPPPGQPATVTVHRDYCYGSNVVDWTAASGTVGWYEIQTSTHSNFSTANEVYRGPLGSVILDVSATTHVRGRACNSEGCSSWKQAPTTAIYVNYCL